MKSGIQVPKCKVTRSMGEEKLGQIIKNPFAILQSLGFLLKVKRELSIRNDLISFAFHSIHDESNVEKKLERSWAGDGRLVRDRKT